MHWDTVNVHFIQSCRQIDVFALGLYRIFYSVRIVGRIVYSYSAEYSCIHQIRIIVAARPPLACSSLKPQRQALPWARHSKQLPFVCLFFGGVIMQRDFLCWVRLHNVICLHQLPAFPVNVCSAQLVISVGQKNMSVGRKRWTLVFS